MGNPSVTEAWYGGTIYAPTVFPAFSTFPFSSRNDTSALDTTLLQNARPISASALNYVYIHRTETIDLDRRIISGPFDVQISAVAAAGPLTTCAVTGCVLNVAISYQDTIQTRYALKYQYATKEVIVAAVGLFAAPWAISGLIVGVLQWHRANLWLGKTGGSAIGKYRTH